MDDKVFALYSGELMFADYILGRMVRPLDMYQIKTQRRKNG